MWLINAFASGKLLLEPQKIGSNFKKSFCTIIATTINLCSGESFGIDVCLPPHTLSTCWMQQAFCWCMVEQLQFCNSHLIQKVKGIATSPQKIRRLLTLHINEICCSGSSLTLCCTLCCNISLHLVIGIVSQWRWCHLSLENWKIVNDERCHSGSLSFLCSTLCCHFSLHLVIDVMSWWRCCSVASPL